MQQDEQEQDRRFRDFLRQRGFMQEGELYRVVDGELVLVETDPDDDRKILRIGPHAAEALKQARKTLTRHLRWRYQMDEVAEALIEMHSDEASVPATMRAWLNIRQSRRRQESGR